MSIFEAIKKLREKLTGQPGKGASITEAINDLTEGLTGEPGVGASIADAIDNLAEHADDISIGGGGSSTVVVYDGSVETALDGNYAYSADTDVQNEFAFDFSTDPPTFPDLTIVFEGVTYEVQYGSGNGWGAPWDDDNNTYDFTDYPFNVYPADISESGIWEQFNISTATAGEYDIKISGIPNGSGGGESDYSTCTVTLVVEVSPDTTCPQLFIVPHLYNDAMETYIPYTSSTSYELETVLYKGGVYAYTFDKVRRTVSGNATIGSYDGTGYPITIFGDCTITIGGDK